MRTNFWNRKDGGDQGEIQITKGLYVLSFNTKYVPNALIPNTLPTKQLSIVGKTVAIKDWQVLEAGDRCELWLDVVQNPIPLLGIVLAVGVIGITAAMLLDSVDKVVEDVTQVVKTPAFGLLAIALLAFIAGPYILPYLRRRE